MLRLVLAILDLVVTIYSWAKPASVYPHHIRNQLHHQALGVHNRAALLALLVLLRVQAARHNPVAVHNFFSSKPVYHVFIVHIILTSFRYIVSFDHNCSVLHSQIKYQSSVAAVAEAVVVLL